MTLYGKINIVRSLALSKLTFVASVLPIPDDFIKRVNKQIVEIWSHQNPKIKRTTMINEKKEDGLGMPDFDLINKSLKAA